MHILIIPSWYPTFKGDISGSFFREQTLAIQKNGYKVGVVYPQLRSLKQWKSIFNGQYGLKIEDDEGVPTYRYLSMNWFPRMPNMSSKLFIRAGMLAYNQYIKDYGTPDIIHVHSALYGGCLALKINELHNIPYVITEHFSAYPRGLISVEGINLAKKVIDRASCKIAVSKNFANDLAKVFEEDPSSWEEIPNIVNDNFLIKSLNKTEPDEIFNFITISALTNNKGIHNVIEAFSKAFPIDENIHLKIGGDGIAKKMLEQLAKDCNVANRVHFLGKLSRNDVLEEVSQSNVLVVASEYETFSVVVIEALALGKPVISTRCGGPESIIRPQDGILVPQGDIKALGNSMSILYDNYSEFHPETIREGCIERYSEKAIINKLREVYDQVISVNAN